MVMKEEFLMYKEEVTVSINGEDKKYELLPLCGNRYGEFIEIMKKFEDVNEDESLASDTKERFLESMDEKVITIVHSMLLETFIDSYNIKADDEKKHMDRFISKNLFSLIPVLFTVNLPKNNVEN